MSSVLRLGNANQYILQLSILKKYNLSSHVITIFLYDPQLSIVVSCQTPL